MGDRYLRKLLVVGACSALAARKGHNDALRRWASGMLERKTVKYKFKLTAVALANKLARIVCALATKGGAITMTVRSWPETNRLSWNKVSPQGDPHRGRRRSDVNQRNGTEARGKGQAPYRARFADWAKSHADQHQGQRDIRVPRQQAEDMTAPEAFAKPQPNP